MRVAPIALMLLASTLIAPLGGCASAEFDFWQAELDAQSATTQKIAQAFCINDLKCSVVRHETYRKPGIGQPRMTTGVKIGQHNCGGREWELYLVSVADVMPYYPITPEVNEIVDVRILARSNEGGIHQWHRSDYDAQAMSRYLERGRFVMGSFVHRQDRWTVRIVDANVTITEELSNAAFSIDLARRGS